MHLITTICFVSSGNPRLPFAIYRKLSLKWAGEASAPVVLKTYSIKGRKIIGYWKIIRCLFHYGFYWQRMFPSFRNWYLGKDGKRRKCKVGKRRTRMTRIGQINTYKKECNPGRSVSLLFKIEMRMKLRKSGACGGENQTV